MGKGHTCVHTHVDFSAGKVSACMCVSVCVSMRAYSHVHTFAAIPLHVCVCVCARAHTQSLPSLHQDRLETPQMPLSPQG